jgi:hypothetical protein
MLLYNRKKGACLMRGGKKMKVYHLYLIRDDIAKSYFGREHLLFDLFVRFTRARSLSDKKMLYKQIQYITKPLPQLKLHHRVEQSLLSSHLYKRAVNVHTLSSASGDVCGTLIIKPQYAILESVGNLEVEMIFFEILRKNEITFLAMEYTAEQCGWLNPIKQERKYV